MEYKGYLITPSKQSPKLYAVATEGRGGKVPNCLAGLFTDRGTAMRQVDRYLEGKEKANAKDTS